MAEKTYKDAIREALDEEMARDETVYLLGEDIALFGSIFRACEGLCAKYGQRRVLDMPISEAAIIGTALGSALTGLRPVAELMFIDFTGVCMDQIANQVAKIRYMLGGQVTVPLVIRTQGGAIRSFAAQHSQSLEAWFMHIPGIKVVMPATPYDAKGLLKSAIRDDNPVLYIEHKNMYNLKGEVPDGEHLIPIGKADVKRQGTDVTLVGHSLMVLRCLEAADRLAQKGIDCEVIDLRTLSPLDMDTVLESIAKTNRVVIVDEGHKQCGAGAEVAARIADDGFNYLDAPIKRVAALDCPIPFSRPLEEAVIPSTDEIVRHIQKVLA
ncbi:MAG: hypothetical protein A2Z18_00080 [Armatimonadetes bacterium RBG_16_58_9]|nr:MAG: hypothetical protein A2Z18_00080 [Armatimonadetes bacterium RBG_16_58_9]